MKEVDQCLGVEILRPSIVAGVWIQNLHKAPIPTRHEIWDHSFAGIRVISTVEVVDGRGIELHLSVSGGFGQKFPSEWEILKVRKDFGAENFEQDDHGSKVAHLWLPIEKDKRGECPCKEEGE